MSIKISPELVQELEDFASEYLDEYRKCTEVFLSEFLTKYEDSKWVTYDKNNPNTLPPRIGNKDSNHYSKDVFDEDLDVIYYSYTTNTWYHADNHDSYVGAPTKWKLLE